jgi:hypothetical protein
MCAKQAGNRRVVKTQAKSSSSKGKSEATPRVGSKAAVSSRQPSETLPFTRKNYLLLLIGVGLIVVGFLLMSLDDFVDATQFSISLYIAPIFVVGGFVEIIFAIMYKEKKPDEASAS